MFTWNHWVMTLYVGKIKEKVNMHHFHHLSGDKFCGDVLINPWGTQKHSWKSTSEMGLFILLVRICTNPQLFERYDQVFEDEILEIHVMVCFPKLDELVEWPRDLWIGYYPCTIYFMCNEILTHSKKWMLIIGRIFPWRRAFTLGCLGSSFSM